MNFYLLLYTADNCRFVTFSFCHVGVGEKNSTDSCVIFIFSNQDIKTANRKFSSFSLLIRFN